MTSDQFSDIQSTSVRVNTVTNRLSQIEEKAEKSSSNYEEDSFEDEEGSNKKDLTTSQPLGMS